MDRRDCLWLGAETETKSEATARSAVLVGENPASGGQQPGQCGFRLRQAVNPAPSNREGLGDGVLGVGLDGRSSKGEGQDGAVILLEGSLETRDVADGHPQRTEAGRREFPRDLERPRLA